MNKYKRSRILQSSITVFILILWVILLVFSFDTLVIAVIRYELLQIEIFLVVLVILAHIAATVIHELGHLVFGSISGYQFSSFRIFSITLMKEDEKIKLKRVKMPGTAGQCLMAPPEINNGKMPTVLYNIGGCLLGIIVVIISVIGMMFTRYYPIPYFIFAANLIMNLHTVLSNGIPMHTRFIPNDGMNVISLRNDRTAMEAFRLQLLISVENHRGLILSEMPDEWFSMPHDQELGNNFTAARAYLCCLRLIEKCEYDEAEAAIEHLFYTGANLTGNYRAILLSELLFIYSYKGETEKAEAIFRGELKRYLRAFKRFFSVCRSVYAYALLVRGDDAVAYKIDKRFERTKISRLGAADRKIFELEKEKMKEVRRIYESLNTKDG